jgi:diphthamide biosynthesis methyltransferase
MSTITFDTLKYVKQLEASGIATAQAEAFVNAQRDILSEVMDTSLATRGDVQALEKSVHADIERLERKMLEHDGKFMLLQWMLAAVLAVAIANFAKQYF